MDSARRRPQLLESKGRVAVHFQPRLCSSFGSYTRRRPHRHFRIRSDVQVHSSGNLTLQRTMLGYSSMASLKPQHTGQANLRRYRNRGTPENSTAGRILPPGCRTCCGCMFRHYFLLFLTFEVIFGLRTSPANRLIHKRSATRPV
jgi:hypothetical protein